MDANGVARKGARKERLRAKLSNFYFRDAVNPVTPAELAAAHVGPGHEAIDAEPPAHEIEPDKVDGRMGIDAAHDDSHEFGSSTH